MKKIIAMVLALTMLAALFAGCQSSGSKTLKVAISPDFAPMEFVIYNEKGEAEFAGFDIMLAEYIAAEMGKELQIMPMDFGACQAAVAAGTVDMSISGFSWTEERAENYNLSDYYYAGDNETEQVLITLKENAGKYTTVESMAGLKVGAQTATTCVDIVNNDMPGAELVSLGLVTDMVNQLVNGKLVAIVVDGAIAMQYVENNATLAVADASSALGEALPYCVAVAKGDPKGAAEVYDNLSRRLFDDFGIYPSEETRAVYRTAAHSPEDRTLPMDEVLDHLQEPETLPGAMQCDYDYFKILCYAESRSMERSGNVTHIALLSVLDSAGKPLNKRSLNRIMDQLGATLRTNLRRGDTISQCSISQFIIMLPNANYENSCMVCRRVLAAFNRAHPHVTAKIQYLVQPLSPSFCAPR